jgi:hypothetical protein
LKKQPTPFASPFVKWGTIIVAPAVVLLIILQIRHNLTDGSGEMVTLAKSRIRLPGIVYAMTWIIILSIMGLGAAINLIRYLMRKYRKKENND